MMISLLIFLFGFGLVLGSEDASTLSFFKVNYPSVVMAAEVNGNITINAGPDGGNIFLKTTKSGSIFIDGTDMMKIIEMLNSLPPIWSDMSEHGSLGNFLGGTAVHLKITAQDPENFPVVYAKVSGAFPPGLSLDPNTGKIQGIIPDIDAVYEFGIRATDIHGKHADQTFTIITHEKDQCLAKPCKNGGICIDDISNYNCSCPNKYGGPQCQYDCASNAVGISSRVHAIPDAQMSAHYSASGFQAWDGRLYSKSGWVAEKAGASWLQVDLGRVMKWFGVDVQGAISSSHYTTTYTMTYSVDGDNFKSFTYPNGTVINFQGSTLFDTIKKSSLPITDPPVHARYIRFMPMTGTAQPGMRVEVYACPL